MGGGGGVRVCDLAQQPAEQFGVILPTRSSVRDWAPDEMLLHFGPYYVKQHTQL